MRRSPAHARPQLDTCTTIVIHPKQYCAFSVLSLAVKFCLLPFVRLKLRLVVGPRV